MKRNITSTGNFNNYILSDKQTLFLKTLNHAEDLTHSSQFHAERIDVWLMSDVTMLNYCKRHGLHCEAAKRGRLIFMATRSSKPKCYHTYTKARR